MKRIETAEIAKALANIATAEGVASTVPMAERLTNSLVQMFQDQLREKNVWVVVQPTHEGALAEMLRPRVLELLKAAQDDLADAALPKRVVDKMERIAQTLSRTPFDGAAAKVRLDELMHDLVEELSAPMFLHISPEKRTLYEQSEPLFGPVVESKFPKASRDIASAGRCYAVDEWTACVYHLMRAVEEPLHVLAEKHLNIVFPKPIEFENWKNIVDKIDSQIAAEVKRLEGTTASHQRNETLKLYGDVSLQIRHFKNAWRNDAAHGREHYDERQTDRVFSAVKSFMQMMAELP